MRLERNHASDDTEKLSEPVHWSGRVAYNYALYCNLWPAGLLRVLLRSMQYFAGSVCSPVSGQTQSYSDPMVMLMSWPTLRVEWNHLLVSSTTGTQRPIMNIINKSMTLKIGTSKTKEQNRKCGHWDLYLREWGAQKSQYRKLTKGHTHTDDENNFIVLDC